MSLDWKTVEISWDDCPWISEDTKDATRKEFLGQPDFLNSLAGYDFMPLVQDAVINGKALDELLANPPKANPAGETRVACDFAWSGAGAENVVALRRGNVVSIEAEFHCDHLVSSSKKPEPGVVDRFIQEFLRLGIHPHEASTHICGDESGGGRLVMDELDARGWYLERLNTALPGSDFEHYASIAAEMWFALGKHITLKTYVLPPKNQKLRGQLLSRKTARSPRGKLAIETKEEMRKRNVASPDVADAVCMVCLPGGGNYSGAISWAVPMAVGHPMQEHA